MSKLKVKWSKKGELADFAAAQKYLALLTSDAKAKALVAPCAKRSLSNTRRRTCCGRRNCRSCRAYDPHVDEDLKRIEKEKSLPQVLLIRGDMGRSLPLVVADGYHRICAVIYFDESAPVSCRIVTRAR